MNERFFNLTREKQDRIINAAIYVFSANGYDKAGTDAIIKEAGISKGLLFHYFGSKLNLYSFVAEYCARYMIMELQNSVGSDIKNPVDRIRAVEESKLRMLRVYPYLDLFIISLQEEKSPEALPAARSWSTMVEEVYRELIEEGADESLLRPGLDIAGVRELVSCALEGFKIRRRGEGYSPQQTAADFIPYLEMIKTGVCREG